MKEKDSRDVNQLARRQYDEIWSASKIDREMALEDRRFCYVSGAQWDGQLFYQFENKPKLEVNKVQLSTVRIENEYRNNRITVYFTGNGPQDDKKADVCAGLFRADEKASRANEAYDNAYNEEISGGIGGWRLRAVYENEYKPDIKKQRIRIEPIFEADSSIFFDLDAKRQDKSDARFCFVITSMTVEKYKETYNDEPSSWPKMNGIWYFNWYDASKNLVYVAEYYVVEEKTSYIKTYKNIDGSESEYKEQDFNKNVELEEILSATGSVEIEKQKTKIRKIRKYILSGNGVLEDCGYIAGKNIPIVVVYGKRCFIDGIEKFSGNVRLVKDIQRLLNMEVSKLAEISALSSLEKPIFTPQQIAGHERTWATDNIENHAFLSMNTVTLTGPDGNEYEQIVPPTYTKVPSIPPAQAACLEIIDQYMKDILGTPQEAEQLVSNVSGKAVELIQNKIDMQSFIYMSNFAVGMQRCGEIWLGMAQELYTEENRRMRIVDKEGNTKSINIMVPSISEEGEMTFENDISDIDFEVSVDVGPSSSSKRAAIVRALTGMMTITQDPETMQVLSAMAMMNMEGEGISDVRNYFRGKLVRMGVIKPNEEEMQQLQAEMDAKNSQQDPNALLMQAIADEASAKAAKARADTVNTIADAELKKAKTVETMANAELKEAQTVQVGYNLAM